MKIIKLINVCKRYKRNTIFSNINYSFEKGKCYLLKGDNGSGKTTLIKGILGLINFNEGKVELLDKQVGYVPEKIIFPEYISVYQFLYNLGIIKSIDKDQLEKSIDQLLKEWDLFDAKNKNMKNLSKGMSQKTLIIQALLNNPNIFIFDEALNGLDLRMQSKFISLIKELKLKNKTIIICSHYPKYYSDICDITITIEDGKIYDQLN